MVTLNLDVKRLYASPTVHRAPKWAPAGDPVCSDELMHKSLEGTHDDCHCVLLEQTHLDELIPKISRSDPFKNSDCPITVCKCSPTVWSQRNCRHNWNFDRFHPPCLHHSQQPKHGSQAYNHAASLRGGCGPSPTQHHSSLPMVHTMNSQ